MGLFSKKVQRVEERTFDMSKLIKIESHIPKREKGRIKTFTWTWMQSELQALCDEIRWVLGEDEDGQED